MGIITLTTLPEAAIYLLLVSTCHNPPAYQIWSVLFYQFQNCPKFKNWVVWPCPRPLKGPIYLSLTSSYHSSPTYINWSTLNYLADGPTDRQNRETTNRIMEESHVSCPKTALTHQTSFNWYVLNHLKPWWQSWKDVRHLGDKNHPLSIKSTKNVDCDKLTIFKLLPICRQNRKVEINGDSQLCCQWVPGFRHTLMLAMQLLQHQWKHLKTFIRLVTQILKQYSITQPEIVQFQVVL